MYFSIARTNKELNLQTGVLSRLTVTYFVRRLEREAECEIV